MIYDFALQPELVATWHDPRVAYPVVCQMGLGHSRVPCVYPSGAWKNRVMEALRGTFGGDEEAAWQGAKKRIEVLLGHLAQPAVRRNGRILEGEQWIQSALAEHSEFPFGGILLAGSEGAAHPFVVSADRLHEGSAVWNPPAHPVKREANALAAALAPVLRAATQLRFVDPYFDADDPKSLAPMSAFLAVAQRRRTLGELAVQIHFAVTKGQLEQENRTSRAPFTEASLAAMRLQACATRLAPLLSAKVKVVACAWGKPAGGHDMHNRYVLTEIGGIAVQHGLDQSTRDHTDDLTLLSREQHAARWAEYALNGSAYRAIANLAFNGKVP